MKDSFQKTLIGMLAGIACMTASCAEFVGELYQAEWFNTYECGFWCPDKDEWDEGQGIFDEYMVVDGGE